MFTVLRRTRAVSRPSCNVRGALAGAMIARGHVDEKHTERAVGLPSQEWHRMIWHETKVVIARRFIIGLIVSVSGVLILEPMPNV
eukprot:1543964-Pyramimonas_sp.AAC.1